MAKRKTQQQSGNAAKSLKHMSSTTNSTANSRHATRSMTTAASCRAVFDTAELLEQIVLELPMATILTSQRVCQQFRDIVATSKKIQEKLFFRTTGACEYWTWEGDLVEGGPVRLGVKTRGKYDEKIVPDRLNNFFYNKEAKRRSAGLLGGDGLHAARGLQFSLGKNVCGAHIAISLGLMAALFLYLEKPQKQSWQQMHLSDCSSTAASIFLEWDVGDRYVEGAHGDVRADVQSKDGLAMGALAAALRTPTTHLVYCSDKDDTYHNGEDIMSIIEAYDDSYGFGATMRITGILLHGMLIPPEAHRAILDRARSEEEQP